MKVRVEANEVGNARKQPQRFAHDVDGDGRMQWRKGLVAFHFIDQLWRDELVLLHRGPATNHPMADGCWSREVTGVKRVRNKFERDGLGGQGRSLIHKLLTLGVFDPE